VTITFFGSYDTRTHPRIQVMIDGLRAHGVQVQECNAPLKVTTAGRIAVLRQPWRLPLFLASILRCWWRLTMISRRMPSPDIVVIGYMGQFDIHLARRLFRGKPLILDYMISGKDTAGDRRIGGGLKDRLLGRLDNGALRLADIVVVDTEEHRAALPEAYRHKGLVVNVGASQTWFDAARSPAARGRAGQPLKIVFFGLYTPLQGAPTIGAALKLLRRPAEVTMIGQGQELAAAKQAAEGRKDTTKVRWLGWLEEAGLPGTVAEADVCLGIFGIGPKAQRVVPNKVYQGAAAGCAIVTADTPPQRRIMDDAAVFVPPGQPAALAEALDGLADDKHRLAGLKRKAREQAQAKFTPAKAVAPLLEKLNLTV
jgi:glycosyltransferase involved in cell wall biosynthesis